jgi:hypothetical protein
LRAIYLAFVAVAFSMQASAAIVKAGDIISDDATGLDWYALTPTVGYSYGQMTTNFADSNSQFFGYRYARTTDLNTLLANAGYTGDSYNYVTDASSRAAISSLYYMFGQTGIACCNRADGFYDDDELGSDPYRAGLGFLIPDLDGQAGYGPNEAGLFRLLDDQYGVTVSTDPNGAVENKIGSFIVKATVPIPAAVWLFGSALAGLIGFRRYRAV